MQSFFKSASIAAFLSAGLAFAGAINNPEQTADPSDLSSSMDGSGDPGMIVNGDSQLAVSKQDGTRGPSLNSIEVQTDAVPAVPEPSTMLLTGGVACVALVAGRKLARG